MALPKVELPVQAAPINRSKLLQRFMIHVPAGKNPEGKDEFLDVVRGPEPNDRAYFSPEVDPSLGVCRIVSSYAVAPCFWAGGLFSGRR
jgi:hypothetical protein